MGGSGSGGAASSTLHPLQLEPPLFVGIESSLQSGSSQGLSKIGGKCNDCGGSSFEEVVVIQVSFRDRSDPKLASLVRESEI